MRVARDLNRPFKKELALRHAVTFNARRYVEHTSKIAKSVESLIAADIDDVSRGKWSGRMALSSEMRRRGFAEGIGDRVEELRRKLACWRITVADNEHLPGGEQRCGVSSARGHWSGSQKG